jgi:hypothetical protein
MFKSELPILLPVFQKAANGYFFSFALANICAKNSQQKKLGQLS